jgi:tetratricopeptide (TPR) repeat protein
MLRPRVHLTLLVPVLLLAFGLVPAGASAQKRANAASADTGESSEYRDAIREALREFDVGNWNEALVLFERAHQIQPNARTLRGIGFCLFEGRRYVDTVSYLEQALKDPRNPLTDAQRASTEQLLARAQAFVAHVQVKLSPATAVLMVNGERAQLDEASELRLDPGDHELSASAPGFEPRNLRVQIKSGANGPFSLELRSLALSPEDAANAQKNEPSAVPAPQDGRQRLKLGLMVSGFTLAGASLVTATVTGLLALKRGDQLKKQCTDDICPPDQRAALDKANRLAMVSNVTFGLAALGAGLGLTGVLLPSSEKAPATTQLGLKASASFAGLDLHGQF